MSKITKALEKAARERLQRQPQHPTAASAPVEVSIVASIGHEAAAVEARISIDPHIVSATDSKSPIAEQYRMLRTNLQSLRLKAGPKVIVVTSAVHGEGKSVTAINLAVSLARQEGLRVALVDGDLRRGSIQKWLGLSEGQAGLSHALQDGGQLNGSLVRLQAPALSVLPAGPTPDHPAELLESSNMKRVLAILKTQFDCIVIDSPPLLPVADPIILASQADGVLLVVKAGKTQRKTVLQARALLEQAKATILGCILTHVEYYLPGYYRYYRYYRYGAKEADRATTPAAEAPAAEQATTS